jgi:DegV family protein with EDD domain
VLRWFYGKIKENGETMKKIAILTCSNAGLDYIDAPKDIIILRSTIQFDDASYDDFTEMDAKTFYERISKSPDDIPKTAYVALGKIIMYLEDLKKAGYEEALIITISSKLSGLYEAILRVSAEMDMNITVFDSKSLAYHEAYMVLEAYRMAEAQLSVQEIMTRLEFIRAHHKVYFAVDTLLYLVKNGRLSKLSGTLGTMLKLKPVLMLNDEGAVETVEKIRTIHKAHELVFEKYAEETQGKDVITYIAHAHADEYVEWFKEKINAQFKDREVIVTYLTPVVGAHTGPKAIGLGYIERAK